MGSLGSPCVRLYLRDSHRLKRGAINNAGVRNFKPFNVARQGEERRGNNEQAPKRNCQGLALRFVNGV